MSCPSAIFTVNTSSQAVAVGGTIGLGSAQRRFGQAITLNGNTIRLSERGYYEVGVSVVAAPTVAGTVTVTIYNSGVAIPGATASAAVSTAGNPTVLPIVALVRVPCCTNPASLSLVLTGSASTVTNVAVTVEKE